MTRSPSFLFMGLQESLFDALAYSWWMLALYFSDGFLGRMAYGAQTRIMDGTLGRANCLVITMLWSVFKFFMVPIGFQLAALFPPATYATLFAFVWLSYSDRRRALRDRRARSSASRSSRSGASAR